MNLPRCFLFVSALLTATQLFAASVFEGKVDIAIDAGAKGKQQVLTYSIKNPLLRFDINADGQAITSIMDQEKQEMIILMPEQKMYMVMSMKSAMDKAAKSAGVENADIKVTGKTETILGYKCDQLIVTDKNQVTEVWIAPALGKFSGLGTGQNPMGGKSSAAQKWEEQLKGKEGFPLRVISRDLKGKETYKMEATKITPGSLPASLFQPPADYEKFSMPSLGGFNPFGKGE